MAARNVGLPSPSLALLFQTDGPLLSLWSRFVALAQAGISNPAAIFLRPGGVVLRTYLRGMYLTTATQPVVDLTV